MTGTTAELAALARRFDSGAAGRKIELLDRLLQLAASRTPRPATARRLDAVLSYLRAYPDSRAVHARARRLADRLPDPAPTLHIYTYEVVVRLLARFPGRLEIAWDALDDEGPLIDMLTVLVTPGEELGVEDTSLSLQDWFARCRPPRLSTDLAFVVDLLSRSALSPKLQSHLYEQCNLPVRFAGRPRSRIVRAGVRTASVAPPPARRRGPIVSTIRRPLRGVSRGEAAVLDLSVEALAVRALEIYPLTHGNPADITIADVGHGSSVVLIGVEPARRGPLESLHVFLILRNGLPVAYGPAAVFMGCCEMGINFFPEFRGADARTVYAQFMRVLHHWLGVDYFHLTRYGMGEGNPAAIATGAFWFYRRLGFRTTDPDVERLARREEARMREEPGYRSDRRMLRRLSHTEAYLDLSGGRRRPFDFGALGVAVARAIARDFDGDRRRATDVTAARLARLLGLRASSTALRALAPLVSLVPDLETWSRSDLRRLASIVRAKDSVSECRAALGFKAHARLERAWRAAATTPPA